MMGKLGQMGMKQAVKNIDPSNHPMFNTVAAIISGIENEQAAAVGRAAEEANLDLTVNHDREERREELLDVAAAVTAQDVGRYWFEEKLDVDNAEKIQQYAGLDADEWRETLRKWYDQYHRLEVVEKPVEQASPADVGNVAALHVEETYGVTLREFVIGVVNWHRGNTLKMLLAGPIQSYTDTIHLLAEELEQRNDRIEELEQEVERLREKTEVRE